VVGIVPFLGAAPQIEFDVEPGDEPVERLAVAEPQSAAQSV
jgi:hypothetical protein